MGADISHLQVQGDADGGAGPDLTHYYQEMGRPFGLGNGTLSSAPSDSGRAPKHATQAAEVDEGLLLFQLVQLLRQRPQNSLLLSDLGALLPQNLRSGLKGKGGLRNCLQKHPTLFTVSGQRGKESVTLVAGRTTGDEGSAQSLISAKGANTRDSNVPLGACRPDAPFGLPVGLVDPDASRGDSEQKQAELIEERLFTSVQLRGLPYSATVADVKSFLGKFASNIKDEQSVQLVKNRDGRPSGFARVQFDSPEVAKAVRDELHNAVMNTAAVTGKGQVRQTRYVEIFLYSERPHRMRFPRDMTTDGEGGNVGAVYPEVTTEQVIQECRIGMAIPGRHELRLSMLGVVLSAGARAHLKKTNQGLKHLLLQHPHEFRVDGGKGWECVTYLPCLQPSMGAMAAPVALPVQPAAETVSQFTPQQSPRLTLPEMPEIHEGPVSPAAAVGGLERVGSPGLAVSGLDRMEKLLKSAPTTLSRRNAGGTLLTPSLTESPMQLQSPQPTPISPGCVAAWGTATPSDWGTPHDAPHPLEWRPRPRQSCEKVDGQQADVEVMAKSPAESRSARKPHKAEWRDCGPQPFTAATNTWQTVNSASSPPWMLAESDGSRVVAGCAEELINPMGFPGAAAPGLTRHGAARESPCALCLRGLPLTCTEQQVYAFFSKFDAVEFISDGREAVCFLVDHTGNPSGEAIVQLQSRSQANYTANLLRGQLMGSHKIEVSLPLAESSAHASAVPTSSILTGRNPVEGAQTSNAVPLQNQYMGGLPKPPPPLQNQCGLIGNPPVKQPAALEASVAVAKPVGYQQPGHLGFAGSKAELQPLDTTAWGALFEFLQQDTGAPGPSNAFVQGEPAHVRVKPA